MVTALRVITAVTVEVRCTVRFTWRCLLKRTVGINAAHTISMSRGRSHLTPMTNTVPKWSEVTAHLVLGGTHSVHHASRATRMAQVLFVELLRTGKCSRMLLCQWTGEWTRNMVRASSRYVEKMLGPSVAIKWVQHRVAHVVTSIRPRCSQGGWIGRLPVAPYITFLFADRRFNVVILLLKLPEFVYRNWAVTITNTHTTSVT